MVTTKKLLLLIFTALIITSCNIALDSLNVTNGTKYIVKAKRVDRNGYGYSYNIVEVETSWYDYNYKDTANFNVGDTIVITIRKINN